MPTREEKASHVGTATSENTKQKGGYIHSKKKKEKKRKCILPHTTFHTPLRAVLVRKSDGTECTGKREGGKKKFKGTFSAWRDVGKRTGRGQEENARKWNLHGFFPLITHPLGNPSSFPFYPFWLLVEHGKSTRNAGGSWMHMSLSD